MNTPRPALLLVLCVSTARAQSPVDTTALLDSVSSEVVRIGKLHGESIWPGFRPDTIPVAFTFPTHGTLLTNWPGPLPAAFVQARGSANVAWRDGRDLGAASTGIDIAGRGVAQVAIGPAQSLEPSSLVATALHEAFHVLERASARAGRKFGSGENSMLTASYPVFDEENEAALALEGHTLAVALNATRASEQRDLAAQFAATRRLRHRRLPLQYAEFDQLSELNEGLANYALVRALEIERTSGPASWRARAREQLATMRKELLPQHRVPSTHVIQQLG